MVKLGIEEINYINVFESLTGAEVVDCVIKEDKIIFVVQEGHIGRAVGKGGSIVRKVSKIMKKKVEVVEYSKDPEQFIRALLFPARILKIRIGEKDGKRYAVIRVHPQDKASAIGKGGERINRARELMKRHFNFHTLIVE